MGSTHPHLYRTVLALRFREFSQQHGLRKAYRRVRFHHVYSRLHARVGSPTCARHVGECLSTGLADDRQCEMTSKGRCNMQARVFFFFANNIMHKYSDNRPSRSSRSIGVSYITVTRKHSSRQLCTQLGRATLDLMFNSQITTTRPIRVIFCYKVGPPTSVLNWYLIFPKQYRSLGNGQNCVATSYIFYFENL